jgi:hypothetical protein
MFSLTTFTYTSNDLNSFIDFLSQRQENNPQIKNLIGNLEERSFLNKPHDDLISNSPGKELYQMFLQYVRIAPVIHQPCLSEEQANPCPWQAQRVQRRQDKPTQTYYQTQTHYQNPTQTYSPIYPSVPAYNPSYNPSYDPSYAPPAYSPYVTSNVTPNMNMTDVTQPFSSNTNPFSYQNVPMITQSNISFDFSDTKKRTVEIMEMAQRFTNSKFHRNRICDFVFLNQFTTMLQSTIDDGNWHVVQLVLDNNETFLKALTSAYDGMISTDENTQYTQCAMIDSFGWS